jgi:hypothetical protein
VQTWGCAASFAAADVPSESQCAAQYVHMQPLSTERKLPVEPAFPGPAGGKYLDLGSTLFVNRDTCGVPLRMQHTRISGRYITVCKHNCTESELGVQGWRLVILAQGRDCRGFMQHQRILQ